ncbi:MAG: paraquat-inducible protein A, partial [Desulfobulbaceae bacterium]|nr:paraquat-inducible protein A [Desulfobulbaceae bacterium]
MKQTPDNNHSDSLMIEIIPRPVPIIICPDCDLVLEDHTTPEGYRLRCPRCLTTLISPKKNSLIRTAALSLTTLFLFIPAHFNPLLTFDVMGIRRSGSLFDSLIGLSHQEGVQPVAIIALITALILPLCNPALLLLISLSIISGRKKRLAIFLLRLHHHIQEWSMTEIFLIAILITIVKMYNSTVIQYGNG